MTEDDLPARIKSKIYFGDYCWFWMAEISPNGYGKTSVGSRNKYAHRLVYGILVGPIPKGLTLDHLCRVRRCVRPSHLEPVTRGDNARRALLGRRKTHCKHGHELSPENVKVRGGIRHCLPCERRRNAGRS